MIHSDHDFATVAYLRIKKARLVDKSPAVNFAVPEASLFDSKYDEVLKKIQLEPKTDAPIPSSPFLPPRCYPPPTRSQRVGNWVSIGGIQRKSAEPLSLEKEVRECFAIMSSEQAALQNLSFHASQNSPTPQINYQCIKSLFRTVSISTSSSIRWHRL